MATSEKLQVETVGKFFHQEGEFQTAVRMIVHGHAIDELHGS